jgi:hypothetical protein
MLLVELLALLAEFRTVVISKESGTKVRTSERDCLDYRSKLVRELRQGCLPSAIINACRKKVFFAFQQGRPCSRRWLV